MNIRCQYRFEYEGSDVSTARRKSRDYWEYFSSLNFFLGERFIIGKQVFKSLFFCFQFYFTTEENHEDFRGKNRKRREDLSRKYR